ncbi:MAG: pyridoxal kinase [Hyphomicrobiaceae bacterium]|nr:MAG: pyridoxal kinase [Hyphomicrobiaceae bacterium]
MARILAISSQVVRGHVGLCATVPALQSLGHEVWALPTVLLASRPGLGRVDRLQIAAGELAAMLEAIESDGCWPSLDAVLTGYFPSPDAVAVAARAVGRIKAANPSVIVCTDPILGDNGKLYIPEETAGAIRDDLLPLATLATPNLFELGWLSGAPIGSIEDAAGAARRLGPSMVAVTSAAVSRQEVTTLLVHDAALSRRTTPWFAGVPNGAGDLFAGLLLGHLLRQLPAEDAFDAALAALGPVLASSDGRDVLQLSALQSRPT